MRKLTLITFCVALIFSLFNASFAQAEFRKGPYLQNVTEGSIIISWQTYTSTTGTVHYGIGNTDLSVVDNTVSNFHEVELTGLTPETEYMYYVEAGSDISAVATFSTAVSLSTDFRFVAYGDNRPATSTGDTTAHQAVVSLVESLSPKFVVNVGDMYLTNGSDDVQKFFDVEQSLIKNITLFPARGNHEYLNLSGQPDRFKQYFNLPTNLTSDNANAYYSFNYGNSHFLFINTEIDYSLSSAQYAAIESDLNNADADPNIQHIFVVMHRAAHSNGVKHGGDENPELSQYLGPLFVAHNVDIVFQGHDHHYERFQPEGSSGPLGDPPGDPDVISEGVTYIVTGGGGAPLYDVPVAPHTETGVTPNLTSQVAIKTYEAMQIDVSGDSVHVLVWSVNEDINGNGVLDTGEDLNGNGILDSSSILDEFTIDKYLPNITVTPMTIDFGNVNVGSYSDSSMTVTNSGMDDLIIDTVTSPSAPFSKITDTCSVQTLAPSATCTIVIRFAPTDGISYVGSFDIPSNDPATPNVTVSLSGTGSTVDLYISRLFTPPIARAGQTILVEDIITNGGTGTSGASTTKFYLSTNASYDTGDTYLGGRTVPSLAGGGSSLGRTSVPIPSTTPVGSYFIIAVADADGVISESNETNNTKSKPIKVGPDLVVSSLSAPTTATAGQTISISDTTANTGGDTAGASTTKFYLSTDNKLNPGDTYLGGRAIPSLAKMSSNSGSTNVTIPSGTPAGTYYIIAVADADRVVAEANERNNFKYQLITITNP